MRKRTSKGPKCKLLNFDKCLLLLLPSISNGENGIGHIFTAVTTLFFHSLASFLLYELTIIYDCQEEKFLLSIYKKG